MKHLAVVHRLFWKYRWHVIGGLFFVVLSNIFRVLQPQVLRQALDLVIYNVQLHQSLAGFRLQADFYTFLGKTILFFSIVVLSFALLMGVFMYMMRQTLVVMSRLIEYDLRKQIFEHYQKLDTAFYRRHQTGDLMSRITEDVSKVRNYAGPVLLYGFNLVSILIISIWAMFHVNAKLAFYTLAPLPFLSISIYWISSLINKRSEKIQTQLSVLNVAAQESYSGIRVLKSFVQAPAAAAHFSEETQKQFNLTLNLAKVDALFSPMMVLMIGLSTIISVYVGGLQVARGEISPGNIAEFVIYVYMLTWPVTAVGWIASLTQQAAASQKRINEFLNTAPEIVANNSMPDLTLSGDIAFQDVKFVYPDTGIVALNNVSFHIKSGEKVAIVGRTGSGKTTLAELLLRMFDIEQGDILFDGRSIKTLDPANLRSRIGYVPQDVFLFSDTVSANIAFGAPNATQEQISLYAKHAAIDKELAGLPNGYNTVVGERGVMLSGGQKQRISIARALIKSPDIVLLDDCLSAVDTKTEKRILQYFENELTNKTVLLITHRVSGLAHFDKIIVLQNGQIAEMGTHKQLMKQHGYYAEQWALAMNKPEPQASEL